MLEIEIKARLEEADLAPLLDKIKDLPFEELESLREKDLYYQAPDRDFFRTDEALRLRRQRVGEKESSFLTYKGPKEDPLSNTRKELELAIQDGDGLEALLGSLGYRPILVVAKVRRVFCGKEELDRVHLLLDEVEGLGRFIELEYLAEDGLSDDKRENTRNRLLSLLDDLGIPSASLTRDSYLELLIKELTS